MWHHLERGSSPVDWCEDNYTFSPHIAEFVNTISNVLFLVMPPLLMRLHQSYAEHCGRGIHVIWVLLIVVGLSSAYFHATLSLLGQLLDELAILWVIVACYWLWYPKAFIPDRWRYTPEGRKRFSNFFIAFAFLTTFLSFLQPAVNAFCLFSLSVPSLGLMISQLLTCSSLTETRVTNLGRRSIAIWGLALVCWVNDRFFCPWWASVGFPYLHGAWHILIFLASYTAVVIYAYFDVRNNMKEKVAELRYYPSDSWEFGIPFVFVSKR